jgi:hypothetical protein
VNWFLVTANGVVLFLSIQGLERMSQNQQTVISAFEVGAQALQQNASALEVGAKTLEDFGTHMADSVGYAADAFSNFEHILDKHIELARMECEVVLGQRDAVRHLGNITHINSMGIVRGLVDAIEELPNVKAYKRDVQAIQDYQYDRQMKFNEALDKIENDGKLKALQESSRQFRTEDSPSVMVARASNEETRPFSRDDFLFGDLAYGFTKDLSAMCCLSILAEMAFNSNVIDAHLHADIIEYLTPRINAEIDRLDGEMTMSGWVLAKETIKDRVRT